MTRDEALRIAHEKWTKPGATCSESIVDTLCALGILKLDEPKSFPQKLRELIRDTRIAQGDEMSRMEGLQLALRDLGLRIVEK